MYREGMIILAGIIVKFQFCLSLPTSDQFVCEGKIGVYSIKNGCRKAQKVEEDRIQKLKQKTEIDSYAECYPGYVWL